MNVIKNNAISQARFKKFESSGLVDPNLRNYQSNNQSNAVSPLVLNPDSLKMMNCFGFADMNNKDQYENGFMAKTQYPPNKNTKNSFITLSPREKTIRNVFGESPRPYLL